MTSPPRAWHDYGRSRAVLIGTWTYTHLTAVPAAQHSLQRMRALLTSAWCSWPEQRVTVLANQHSPGNLADFLVSQYADVRDVALFYYVGHGQIDDEDQLCFSLVGSRPEPHRRATTSLPFDTVRRALLRSNAATKILILDCCFSGLATRREHALGPLVDEVMERTTGTGAYTMAASSAYSAAWFETDPQIDRPQTYFTKYLADLVEAGIPGQPSALGLHTLFTHVRENLARDQQPIPHERSVDAARDYIFARNAAPPGTHIDPLAEVQRLRREKAQAQSKERALREQAARLTQELQQLRREKEETEATERDLREHAARVSQELEQLRSQAAASSTAPPSDTERNAQAPAMGGEPVPNLPVSQLQPAESIGLIADANTTSTSEMPQPTDAPMDIPHHAPAEASSLVRPDPDEAPVDLRPLRTGDHPARARTRRLRLPVVMGAVSITIIAVTTTLLIRPQPTGQPETSGHSSSTTPSASCSGPAGSTLPPICSYPVTGPTGSVAPTSTGSGDSNAGVGGFPGGVPIGSSGCVLSVQVQLDKSAVNGPPTYPPGQDPTFNAILKNSGTGNCLFDVSGKGVVVTVTPADSTTIVWTTATCTGNKDMRVIGPGDGYTEPVKWNREQSVASCPSAPPTVQPGTYAVNAAVSGVNSAAVGFTLQ